MHRGIVVLVVNLALVLVVRSDEHLKCYMCTSLTNRGCDTDPGAHNIEPVECTLSHMDDWQRTLKQHNTLNAISHIFDVDTSQHYQAAAPMACAKMILRVKKQEITVRSCQTAKTETIDPCKAIQGKYSNDFSKLEVCDLCMHDACNDSIRTSPRILFILVSVVGTIALGAFYNGA
ncbi:uncharacterized protein LOC143186826 [Calliopsis andreniformis]|uniref:uncharacterized protein LOC143186826 n=1 Tax=Calliopsis andreniformis TaxID=337506 RepID=UPI003FCEC2D3